MNCQMQKNSFVTINDEKHMSKILCHCLMIFEEQTMQYMHHCGVLGRWGRLVRGRVVSPGRGGDLISVKQLGPLGLIIIFNWFRLACQNCTVALLPLQRLFCRDKVQNIFYFPVASSRVVYVGV